MRVPLSWLKEYVNVNLPLDELVEKMTLAGLEVSKVDYFGLPGAPLEWDPRRLFVAKILAVRQHPNADRLVLADVDYGQGKETVVTGAPNLFPYIDKDISGMALKGVLALEGSILYDGHAADKSKATLKARAIRGIMNRHMLCSEKELGISEEHTGIIILDADAPVGKPLVDYLGDAVIEFDILPNIARAACIYGVAREIAALTGEALRPLDLSLQLSGSPLSGRLIIKTLSPELNPRFTAGLIENITIKPSPFLMQYRLRLAGMRPINNIVDVSNYVMLETGQATHAFDWDLLQARAKKYNRGEAVQIITRVAEPGESMITLDDVNRVLNDHNMLVTDPISPLGIAGVMGGLESEVRDDTKSVLLESASWNFISTRRTAEELNLMSEAAYRFSRGVHPAQAIIGLRRALQLMQRYSDGILAGDLVDYYPLPAEEISVEITSWDVRRWLGIELSLTKIRAMLEALQFTCEELDAETLKVTVPDHRIDISGGTDGKAHLCEEIARIYGYDRIPSTLISDTLPPQRNNDDLDREEELRSLLVESGLQEIMTYRLTTPESEKRLLGENNEPYVRLANPISNERQVMRRSLLSSVLEIAAVNSRIRPNIRLFEIGQIYLPVEGEELPVENRRMAVVLVGQREQPMWSEKNTANLDFFDLKGVIEAIINGLKINGVLIEPVNRTGFHPGRTARLAASGEELGIFGELHPQTAEKYDLPSGIQVLVADIDFDKLLALKKENYRVKPVPRFPAIEQDIAVVLDEDIPAADIEEAIWKAGGKILAGVRLFDVFRGEQIGARKKSMAYSLSFQSEDKTLTDEVAARQQARIVAALENTFGAKLRA